MKLKNNKLVNTLLALGTAYQLGSTFDVTKADSFRRTKGGTIETISEYGAVIATDDKSGYYSILADVDKDGEVDFTVLGKQNGNAELTIYRNNTIEKYNINGSSVKSLYDTDAVKEMLVNINNMLNSMNASDWLSDINKRKIDFQKECQEADKLNELKQYK